MFCFPGYHLINLQGVVVVPESPQQGRKAIQIGSGTVLLVDSVSVLSATDAESVVVCAVPCDRDSVARTLIARPAALFLAGTTQEVEYAGFAAADEAGVPCATVGSAVAPPDGAKSMWSSGKLSAINTAARRRGAKEGMSVQQAAGLLLAWLRVA